MTYRTEIIWARRSGNEHRVTVRRGTDEAFANEAWDYKYNSEMMNCVVPQGCPGPNEAQAALQNLGYDFGSVAGIDRKAALDYMLFRRPLC